MVSTFNEAFSHVIIQSNNGTLAAEGLQGVWEMNTLCGSDTGAQLRGNNDRDNCISKFSFDSAALAVLKEEITKSNEDLYSEVTWFNLFMFS